MDQHSRKSSMIVFTPQVNGPILTGIFLFLLCVRPAWATEEKSGQIKVPQTEKVFGPEDPGGPYKHPASFDELQNGDLFLVFYGGSGEYQDDTAIYGARKPKGETTWSTPKIIADTPNRSEGNAVVWQAPNGVVWLFYLTRYGDTWSTSRIKAKISTDHAVTWSDPFLIAMEQGMMVRSHPVVLANGDFLLPVYHEQGADTEVVGPGSTSLFLRYDQVTKEWSETNRIGFKMGCIQPAVAKVSDDYFVCYNRRGGDYSPETRGFIVRSESRDGGRTWSPGTATKWPNPNAAVDFFSLKNGHLVLLYNDSFSRRTPLVMEISTDGDKSYSVRKVIADGDQTFAYPCGVQTRDGKIHVIYTTNSRQTIMHSWLDEADLLPSEK